MDRRLDNLRFLGSYLPNIVEKNLGLALFSLEFVAFEINSTFYCLNRSV